MRYSHAALSPVSVGERRTSRPNDIPVRRASAPRRLAWKIVYSSFIAGVAIYVWWRR
jgi:cell division septal protein FtsQ